MIFFIDLFGTGYRGKGSHDGASNRLLLCALHLLFRFSTFELQRQDFPGSIRPPGSAVPFARQRAGYVAQRRVHA